MNDIIINKIQSIQHCVERAREEYSQAENNFKDNFTAQDAAVMNIIRACEQAIDLANHVIKNSKMGIPDSSAASFELIQKKGIISSLLSEKLIKMVRFRNIVIHQYENMDMEIVKSVIVYGLDDLIQFTRDISNYSLKS
jgi:uncharacterized protein YutE (UPF0331/DUF86 family)